MAETTTARPECGSAATCRCTVLAPSVAPVCGHVPGCSTVTNGSSAYAACSASCSTSVVTPSTSRAVVVARMPRGIGASIGVNDTVTGSPAADVSACSISGVCWWVPPTLYVESCPITVLASSASLGLRPAPVVPLAATTTTSSGSTRPASSRGARPRITPVG